MEPVGLAASITPLVQFANSILGIVKKLKILHKQTQSLQQQLEHVIQTLESAGCQYSDAQLTVVNDNLEEVEEILRSIENACPRCPNSNASSPVCFCASNAYSELQDAEQKLQHLSTQVLVLKGQNNSVYSGTVELPASEIGLSRAGPALQFLNHIKHERQLRVIAIYGLQGVGKTTILNKIWNESSVKFARKARVQIGYDAKDPDLCRLQSGILEQLSIDEEYSFPTDVEDGKLWLVKHFKNLRNSGKPVFIAIDNVWNNRDLESIFPNELSKCIPPHSCICVTTRDFSVVDSFLGFIGRNECQACLCPLDCLSLEESKALFRHRSTINEGEHEELVDKCVPLCGGLPAALNLLGGIFTDENQRDETKWKALIDQLEARGFHPRLETLVQASFERLEPNHKAAFLDVVHFFYGWPWSRVARIVGSDTLEVLRSRSLISEDIDHFHCNQSALRVGYNTVRGDYEIETVVGMHDLILKFGEHHTQDDEHVKLVYCESEERVIQWLKDLSNNGADELRNLVLVTPSDLKIAAEELMFLKNAANLQMLHIGQSSRENNSKEDFTYSSNFILSVGMEYSNPRTMFPPKHRLHYLAIDGWDSINSDILKWMLPYANECKEIILYNCDGLNRLPEVPLPALERLAIGGCRDLQSFPEHVKECAHLKEVHVFKSHQIKELPEYLVGLQMLEDLCFYGNVRLPSTIGEARPLKYLRLYGLDQLELPHEIGQLIQLRELVICMSRNLRRIPSAIGKLTKLVELVLWACEDLEELPSELGNLVSLRTLVLGQCGKLRQLPPSIGQLSKLQSLHVDCESLIEVPEEISQLTVVKGLKITSCIKVESKLESLPEEIGQMKRLKLLDVSKCINLEQLPSSICQLTRLECLDVSDCKNLVELPPNLPPNLAWLDITNCLSLESLPASMGQLTKLERLYAVGCVNLVELPPSIPPNLAWLNITNCFSLKSLPVSIVQVAKRGCLMASGCMSLEELPEEMENITSLTKLRSVDNARSRSLGWVVVEM